MGRPDPPHGEDEHREAQEEELLDVGEAGGFHHDTVTVSTPRLSGASRMKASE